ncbi:hypothetical protein SAMN02745903_01221 [Pseudomonas sp. URMO17WK12:I5]|nr:hypothetical protein H040_00904 [Pseudomonas sp. URMO17WK12:I7]SMF07874.1 hypothetical protein SAMN02745903_01221 [Pseudomonas sp. URMO17WK12:I5]
MHAATCFKASKALPVAIQLLLSPLRPAAVRGKP